MDAKLLNEFLKEDHKLYPRGGMMGPDTKVLMTDPTKFYRDYEELKTKLYELDLGKPARFEAFLARKKAEQSEPG